MKTSCNNPECMKQSTWCSQPLIPCSHIPAGNFRLCSCILLTGRSATKVLQMFRHMGLGCLSLCTFFKYQRVCIFVECFHYFLLVVEHPLMMLVYCQWYSISCEQQCISWKSVEWCKLGLTCILVSNAGYYSYYQSLQFTLYICLRKILLTLSLSF